MVRLVRTPRLPAWTLLLCAAGCSASPSVASSSAASDAGDAAVIGCSGDPHAQPYAPGMGQMGKGGILKFVVASVTPPPVTPGDETWTLGIFDGSGHPVTDATFPVLHPWMPMHGHGTGTSIGIASNHDGTYTLSNMRFFMPGLWQTDITASGAPADAGPDAGALQDSTTFYFCVQ